MIREAREVSGGDIQELGELDNLIDVPEGVWLPMEGEGGAIAYMKLRRTWKQRIFSRPWRPWMSHTWLAGFP